MKIMFNKEKSIFEEFLRSESLRNTKQRQEILKKFLSCEKHPSIEELYYKIKNDDPKVGFSTVYRTMKHFCKCGLAREVDLGDGRSRFEHKFAHKHHDHLICIKCGKSMEFLVNEIEKLQEKIAKKYKFEPQNHKMEIYGECNRCRKK